jgi:hypothetical protein
MTSNQFASIDHCRLLTCSAPAPNLEKLLIAGSGAKNRRACGTLRSGFARFDLLKGR